ncbi:hypothetical protein SAMN04487977_101443 [Treponema bryantii]|uniref:Uncharacterized protein n=1 Tax=Treponema bryantii TaxID=163 RepID=A0A1H9AS42_9SPIR|nr:hypothetical protein [Treponema bryantii]SEP79351.1 hypothetical protein SAMN04487977_101443 [Treponema bryantii]
MPRTNKIIDASLDEVQTAKESAIALVQGSVVQQTAEDLFYTDNLEEVENGLKSLNEFSNKAWLLSSIILYTVIYNKELYTDSGLFWDEYAKQAQERIGIDPRDVSEQLSSARFFIQHHAELERQGFDPSGNNRKLARAELATELSGDVHAVIKHLVNDSWRDFKAWYSSFKTKAIEAPNDIKRPDIEVKGKKVYIQGVEAIKVSEKIPQQDKERLEKYISQIFEAMRKGLEPAIVQCYDEKEARVLTKLRDKYRQGK